MIRVLPGRSLPLLFLAQPVFGHTPVPVLFRSPGCIHHVPGILLKEGLESVSDSVKADPEQVFAAALSVPLEPGAEPLDRPQAERLSDSIRDMKRCPQTQVKHGRFHQIPIRHSPDLLQEHSPRKHIDGNISP